MTHRNPTAFLDSLQTGDLVFFHGLSPLSRLIQWAQGSPWSHVALAVRLPQSGRLVLWESVRASDGTEALPVRSSRQPPVPTGERDVRCGVRLVDASEKLRVEAEDRRLCVGVRHLTQLPPHMHSQRDLARRLLVAMAPLDGLPYSRSLGTLFLSWMDLFDACGWTWNGNPGPSEYIEDGLFCSELAVLTLANVNILHAPHAPGTPVPPKDRQAVAAECTVQDLCEPRRFDMPLVHGTGARYDPVETWLLEFL